MRILNAATLRNNLFATVSTFSGQAIIRLVSSLILTRILRPEAYGIMAILMSITFVIEMLGDMNVSLFIIREKNAEEPKFLDTAWTIQLARAVLNSALLVAFAPLIASLCNIAELALPLRVYAISFVIRGLQPMSYALAVRRKQAWLIMYCELGASFLSTLLAIVYSAYSHDYWGMLYGALFWQIIVTSFSYFLYPNLRPHARFDGPAARQILGFTKYIMPSSLITLGLSQFDKVVFLRLFTLPLLGLYGLASNIAGPIEAIISRICQMILYPRLAHEYRDSQNTFASAYYRNHTRILSGILILPAAVGGAAHLLIHVLYPSRYDFVADILRAFMMRATILSLSQPAEDMLIASGEYQVILHGNVFKALFMIVASLLGYLYFGFMGFTYGAALSSLPTLIYYFRLQRKKGFLIWKYEALRVILSSLVWLAAYLTSEVILSRIR